MEDLKTKTQVVFLIDVFRGGSLSADETTRLVNIFCIAIFRTLLYFSQQLGDNVTASKHKLNKCLKWGYKFFNSRCHHNKLTNYVLREFKLRYFEEFEYEMEQKFEERLPKSQHQSNDCLRKALMEIIHDFQWDGPEFFSPVKQRRLSRMKSKSTIEIPRQKNYVFLLTLHPRNVSEIHQFAGKTVKDSEEFLDSFMPPGLYQEFHCAKQLQLFWVDTRQAVENNVIILDLSISSLKLLVIFQ